MHVTRPDPNDLPNRPIEALGNPAQIVDKPLTVSIVEKNILTSIPARHHMIETALKLDSARARTMSRF